MVVLLVLEPEKATPSKQKGKELRLKDAAKKRKLTAEKEVN